MSAMTTDEAASWDPAGTYRPASPTRVGRHVRDLGRGRAAGSRLEPREGRRESLATHLPAARSFLEDLTGEPRVAADLARVALRLAADDAQLADSPAPLPALLELAAGLAVQTALEARRRAAGGTG